MSSKGIQINIQNMYISRLKIYFSVAWCEPCALEPTFPGLVLHMNYPCALDSSAVIVFEPQGWRFVLWNEFQTSLLSITSWYSIVRNGERDSQMWILNEPYGWRKFQMKVLEKSCFWKVSYPDLWMNKSDQTKLPVCRLVKKCFQGKNSYLYTSELLSVFKQIS